MRCSDCVSSQRHEEVKHPKVYRADSHTQYDGVPRGRSADATQAPRRDELLPVPVSLRRENRSCRTSRSPTRLLPTPFSSALAS